MSSVALRPFDVACPATAAPVLAALLLSAQPANSTTLTIPYSVEPRREAYGTAARDLLPADTITAERTASLEAEGVLFPKSTARATTEPEHVIGELREWALLGADWDGEGAEAPNEASIVDAVSFVQSLGSSIEVPEPMLHASGRAGLFWNIAGFYADLEFWGGGKIAYYVERNDTNKTKGVVDGFTGKALPEILALLLA